MVLDLGVAFLAFVRSRKCGYGLHEAVVWDVCLPCKNKRTIQAPSRHGCMFDEIEGRGSMGAKPPGSGVWGPLVLPMKNHLKIISFTCTKHFFRLGFPLTTYVYIYKCIMIYGLYVIMYGPYLCLCMDQLCSCMVHI